MVEVGKSEDKTVEPAGLVLPVVVALIVLVAIGFRFYSLANLPGINGDEAFFGVKAVDLLEGNAISWQTGSGLPLNPFYFFPLVALHTVFEPSFFLLRILASLFGTAAVLFVGWKFREVTGRWSALAMTVLVAALPTAIAYSRIGWDPCQTLLFTAIAVYFALRRKKVLTSIAFIACLIVHATNIFILPFLLAPFLLQWMESVRDRQPGDSAKRIQKTLRIGVAVAIGLLTIGVGLAVAGLLPQRISDCFLRVLKPDEFAAFLYHFGNMFNGVSTYDYLVGGPTPIPAEPHILIFWILVVIVLLVSLSKAGDEAVLIWAFVISLLVFYLLAGAQKMRPDDARYALWSVVPGIYLFVTLLSRILSPQRACVVCAVLAIGCLISFQQNFFHAIVTRNAVSHQAFLTGEIEPKQAAAESLLDQSDEKILLVQDWWAYWPLRYLVGNREDLRITIAGQDWDPRFPEDFRIAQSTITNADTIHYVGFTNLGFLDYIRKNAKVTQDTQVDGFGNMDVLHVLKTESH